MSYSPDEKFPCILTLHGGTHRGREVQDVAAFLANFGFASLALAYFKAHGLPSLNENPFDLSYFEEAVDLVLKVSKHCS